MGQARRLIADMLGADPRLDEIIVCASEIVTNAIRHSGEPRQGFKLTVVTGTAQTHVIVHDAGGADLPCIRRGHDDTRTGGRGIAIVDSLADAWGFFRDPSGTSVWFRFLRDAPVAAGR